MHSSYINFNTASEKFWQATGESNLAYKSWPQQKLLKFSFGKHPTVLWPVEQSYISVCQVWLSSLFALTKD